MQKNLAELPDFAFLEIENIITTSNNAVGLRKHSNHQR